MIEQPPPVYIDANVFVEFFETVPQRMARLEAFFDHLKERPGKAATSELTLAEVLGKQAPGIDRADQKKFYSGLLCENTFIDLRSITLEILIETGELRRSAAALGRSVKLPDAVHIVTATSAGCLYFLSSDRRIYSPSSFQVIVPDEDGLAEIEKLLDA